MDSLCRSLGSFTYLTEATVKAKNVTEIQSVHSKFWKDTVITWLDLDNGSLLLNFESEEDGSRDHCSTIMISASRTKLCSN